MKFDIFNIVKIIIKILFITVIVSINSNAFEQLLNDILKKDNELMVLEKKLLYTNSQKTTNSLEDVLKYGLNYKKNLEISILERKYLITLNTISLYLNVLGNKSLDEISKQKSSARYLKAVSDFNTNTKQKYIFTNLEKMLDTLAIPKDNSKAYTVYLSQDDIRKEAIAVALKIKKSMLKRYIHKYYLDYAKSINLYLEKLENSKILDKRLIELKYNMLLQKAKISFVTGNLLTYFSIKKHTLIQNYSKVKLKKIHFLGNSILITSYSMPILKNHAKKLKKINNFTLELYGYSDSLGTKEQNLKISKERVENEQNTLVDFGIDKSKIKTYPMGESSPIATNKTKKGRLLNRRVEFKVITNEI